MLYLSSKVDVKKKVLYYYSISASPTPTKVLIQLLWRIPEWYFEISVAWGCLFRVLLSLSQCCRSMLDAEGNSLWHAVCWCFRWWRANGEEGGFAWVTSNSVEINHFLETFPPITSNQSTIFAAPRGGHSEAQTPSLYNTPCSDFDTRGYCCLRLF